MHAPCITACNTRISLPFLITNTEDGKSYVTIRIDGDDGDKENFSIIEYKCCNIFLCLRSLVEQQTYGKGGVVSQTTNHTTLNNDHKQSQLQYSTMLLLDVVSFLFPVSAVKTSPRIAISIGLCIYLTLNNNTLLPSFLLPKLYPPL